MTGLFTNTIAEATSGSGITFSNDIVPATPLSHRNMVINGAMRVAQRGTQFTGVHGDQYVTDRFLFNCYAEDELRVTCEQSSTAPNDQGFNNSLLVNCTQQEASWSASAYARISYTVESQDLQQLCYGTSNAQITTLSFWVKSSLTGTYAVSMYQYDGNDNIGGTYTIDSADTWEKKTLTFAGNTAATIADDNTAGITLHFVLATGGNYTGTDNTSWGEYSSAKAHHGHTANWGTNTSHNFYITGVQLELGSVATPFEMRSYGEELQRCQRYYLKTGMDGTLYTAVSTDNYPRISGMFPTAMRASPSSPTGNNSWNLYANSQMYEGWKNVTSNSVGPTEMIFSAEL